MYVPGIDAFVKKFFDSFFYIFDSTRAEHAMSVISPAEKERVKSFDGYN